MQPDTSTTWVTRPRTFYIGFSLAVVLALLDSYLLVQGQAAGRHSSLLALVLAMAVLMVWHRFHSRHSMARQLGGYGVWVLLVILGFTAISLYLNSPPPQAGAAAREAQPAVPAKNAPAERAPSE